MNQREIKFRAWNPIEKMMTVNFAIHAGGYVEWDEEHPAPELVLMQFTGLHDKNGKPVYEGDVVRFEVWERFHEDDSIKTRVVDWNEKLCGWNPMCQHTDVEDGYYNWEVENVEVIGNVFENPELLRGK